MARQLLRSTSVVAGFTLLSRILGFARDVILASIFGAGGMFDAFVIAFKLPNFLRRLFGEGAFSQAFVPILAEYKSQEDPRAAKHFVNHVSGTLAASVLLVVLIAEIAAPLLIMIFAPGFLHDPTRFYVAEHMLRVMFPYLLLIVLTAFAGAVLNTCSVFGPPAFAPVLLNLALIGAALLFAPHASMPIYVLGFGVLIGGVAQLLLQLPFLKRVGLLPRMKLGFKDPATLRVVKRMVPALFGVSVAQISLLVDNFFASFLPAGSISWLYYSDRLIYFPLGVIGVALATVVMPHLSRQHAKKDEAIFSGTLDWALRCVLLVGLPCAVGLFVLAGPILATLIHYGKFNVEDVVMTAKSLRAFAVGLPAFMGIKVLASAFYARQNIKTPVKIAAFAVVVNLCLNLALIYPMQHAGLALATSLSSTLNALLLCVLLIKNKVYSPSVGWLRRGLQLLVANSLMAALIVWLAGPLSYWLTWTPFVRVWHLCWVIFAGIVGYFIMLGLLRFRWQEMKPIAE